MTGNTSGWAGREKLKAQAGCPSAAANLQPGEAGFALNLGDPSARPPGEQAQHRATRTFHSAYAGSSRLSVVVPDIQLFYS